MDKKWLSYWKKSLLDSLNGEINLEKSKHFEIENVDISESFLSDSKNVNNLIDTEENRINAKDGISDKNSKHWKTIEAVDVLISPIKIKILPERQVYLKDRAEIFPFWYRATLDRQGKLSVPENIFPIFQRKFLEPLADEKTDFTFSSVENVDKAACIGKENYREYQEYIDYVRNVFQSAAGQSLEDYTCQNQAYHAVHTGIILLSGDEIYAAMNIINLYEKILQEKHLPALLKHFINLNNTSKKPPLNVSEFIEPGNLHVGQMGAQFPLSISQRKSLYTFLKSESKVFAVNGPPGTGKTTLLQSVVANKMVEKAIEGGDAPIILACSTNNQAVTNIIESFSKSETTENDLVGGRWLPEIYGYATYLPSTGKKDVELNGINYKKADGEGLFSRVENSDYLKIAKEKFLQKSAGYFHLPYLGVKESVDKLRKEIADIQSSLKCASHKWVNYLEAEETLSNDYRNVNSDVRNYYSEDGMLYELPFDNDISNFKKLEERIIEYFKNENFFRGLFCALHLKFALNSRKVEINIILRDSPICITPDFIYGKINMLEIIDHKITIAKDIKHAITAWKLWKKENGIKGNPPKTEGQYQDFENLKIQNGQLSGCFYDELDVTLRHKAFLLALHYWEGRWLLQLEDDLKSDKFKNKGIEPVKNRWKRQAMLTPCFVSTFYMAPKFFSAFAFLRHGENGKNLYDTIPLFDFIDLLVVDESGQVSPEVGVATFALARQAIVVGDVKQIEPVWNITGKVDVGNLTREGLIKDGDFIHKNAPDEKGFLASSGNIMKMAQNASEFKESGLNEKGVLLVEHRRCYDEIINYCNELAYNGQLRPLRGKAKNMLFPPMYCIHVEGESTKKNASRYNLNEVKAIVEWLRNNKDKIEAKYQEKVEDLVGIITPFVGQKNELKTGLKQAGFEVNKIKMGTVHALQGGERRIILFSMIYGKGDTGTMFFDRDNKPNMLNVAVSRAKDSFIVFANTRIFDRNAKTPSGILANHLTENSKGII
jgi:hypothetical protein